jgi:exosortase E/protease (VPEID-CTERM system)
VNVVGLRGAESGSTPGHAALFRLLGLLTILLGEYGIVAVHFDGGDLAGRGGWLARFSGAGEIFTLLIVTVSAGLLLHFRRLQVAWSTLSAAPAAIGYRWLVLHFVSFCACYAAGLGLFARSKPDAVGLWLVALGTLTGMGAVLCLARALFGAAAMEAGKVLARAVAAGGLLGILAWQVGLQLRPFWPHLTRATLAVSAFLLRLASSGEVRMSAEAATLGLGAFEVEIAPGCSGVEGMGLVGIFVGSYLFRFRSELRLARAWLLVPLAVGLAWSANALRIAALVALGARWSPDIAFGGFHSKAGWLLFCAIALGVVTLLDRTSLFKRTPSNAAATGSDVDNPTAGYCSPFLAVLAVGLFSGLFAGALDYAYALRLAAAGALLFAGFRYVRADLATPASWVGPAAGVAVFWLWLWLTPVDTATSSAMAQALDGLPSVARVAWLVARVVGTVVMAPLVEELAFRGFLQRRLMTRDFEALPYAQVSPLAVLGSALVFGALHPSLLLGTAAGIVYSLTSRRRGLFDAVLAHATTNLLLAVWALGFARWDLLG